MNTTFEREIKDKNYTVMSNYHLQDKSISLKAKGLLSQLLSYSSNWVLTIKGLCAISKEQEKAMKNTIKELENHNYLTRQKLKDNKGRFYYKYIIHEKPKIYPGTHNLPADNPQVEKDTQINTNQINTNNKDKKDIDFKDCIDNKIFIENNLVLKKLVICKYINDDDLEMYKYDELIRKYISLYDYFLVMKVTCYILSKYKQNKGLDEYGNKIINKYGYYKDSLINNIKKINDEIEMDWFEDNES